MFKAELQAAEVDPRFTKKETQSAVSKKMLCNFRPIALKRLETRLQFPNLVSVSVRDISKFLNNLIV